jgi:peptidyl-prolyl cis-trans isomerase D
MMKAMRENTKIILWIVVVAFVVTIFAVWGLDLQTGGPGGPQQTLVGRVNGVPVTPQVYQSVYSQLASQYRSNSPDGSLSYSTQELLRDQAWESIVNNMLTNEQIEELGITVTDQEILTFLREAPPAEVRQYFVDEAGNFDYAAYQAALNNPDADWTAVEDLARQRIPMYKLNQHLMAQVHVGRRELQQAYEEENTRLVVEYVRFPIAEEDLGDFAPSDANLQEYYNANSEDFRVDEKAVIRYVTIPLEPSDQDRDDVNFTVGIVRGFIEADGFETTARTYSQAQTADVGGDTGFIMRAQRDERVMAAVDSLAPGVLSEPIWTDDGVYLVELVETEEEEGGTRYRLNEIYLPLTAGASTTDSLVTLAQDLQRAAVAEDGSLEQAAASVGVSVETTPPFTANTPIEGIGFVPAISRFAFANDPGSVSSVLGDEDSYFVCEVVERIPAGTRPLDEVRDAVSQAIILERRRSAVLRKAEGFVLSTRATDATFQSASELYGLTVATTDTFTVRDAVAAMPPRSPFAYAAFSIKEGETSPPVESFGSYYVLRVLYRAPFDQEGFLQQAEAIRMQLLQNKAQEYIAHWYDQLRENSEIEDFRSSY